MSPPTSGPEVELRAFGAPELQSPEAESQSVLARPKLLGLLSFLAFSPPGFYRRDTLLGLFWPETDQKRARRALRQSLYYLRQSLGAATLLARGEEEIGLDESRLWSDVRAFETAIAKGHDEEALELYRGELLAGFFVAGAPEFEQWLDRRRAELRRKASDAAWSLAKASEAAANAAGAGYWARRSTAIEPFDEGRLAQALELLDRLGDRSGALQLYESFGRRLAQELEIAPAPETQALVARIRARVGATGDDATAEPDVSRAPDDLSPAGERLAAASLVERTDATEPQSRSPRKPRRRGLVATAIVLAATIAIFQLFRAGRRPAIDPGLVVVAVFDNRTGDPSLDPLGRMAADWVTQALHQSGIVEVVPSTIDLAPRADFANGPPRDPAELAASTGAGTVITGAYYARGDSLEIQAQIVGAADGRLLSALPPIGSPLALPGSAVDSLSRRVVRTLAVLVGPGLAGSADPTTPPLLEAYRQYLEGFRNFQSIPLRMREALPYFYRAVELDSAFLAPRFYLFMAHANLGELALADSHARVLESRRMRLSQLQRDMLDWLTARRRGDQMAALVAARRRGGVNAGVQAVVVNRPHEAVRVLKAIDLEPYFFPWLALMEAYHLLGDYRSELDEARRGREAYPSRLRMVDSELRALAALGRIAELRRRLEEAALLPGEDQLTVGEVMTNVVAELRTHGHREAAVEVAGRALAWWQLRPPEEAALPASQLGLAVALYQAERWEEATSILRRLSEEAAGPLDVDGYLGTLAARRGDRTAALAISNRLEGRTARDLFAGYLYRQARIAAQLGDRDRAISLLREALARGMPFGVWFHRDIDLEPLHGFPPFEEFLKPRD